RIASTTCSEWTTMIISKIPKRPVHVRPRSDPRWPSWSSQAGTRSSSSNTRKSSTGTENGCREMGNAKLTTYRKTNFEKIETAIGTAVKPVAELEVQFEAAAMWFRLDKRRPKRPAPSKQHEKLAQIAKSARRLLKKLGISDLDNATDGPGDQQTFTALVLSGE